MDGIRERDTAALLEIVHDGASEDGMEPFPSSVLRAIVGLIPSDACVGYEEVDYSGRFRIVEDVLLVGDPPSKEILEALHALGWQDPLHSRLHARERRVLRLSDFLGRRERRKLAYDAAVWRPYGIDDSLRLWLPAPPGRARSIYLERSGRNYTDRERRLFSLLRPHLVRMRASAEFRRRLHGEHGLTTREAEVLGWLARGKTNVQIARVIFVSPHTVRKHVENIFEKLGVHTRTEAAASLRAASRAPR